MSLKLDFPGLLTVMRRGLRSRSWFRLSLVDRGLFRCALWVAKVHGRIRSLRLMVKVLGIVLKLLGTSRSRIFQAGSQRACELFRRFEERGVFEWAPKVREWLMDPAYVFRLGLVELFGPQSSRRQRKL